MSENSSNNGWYWNNSSWNNNNKNNSNNFGCRAFCEELDNNYRLPLETVFEAYYDCIKHNKKSHGALEFSLNYWDNLVSLWRELNNGTYEIGKSICFIVTKPKLREVFASDFRDRIVHHLIMLKIGKYIENQLIDNTFNCRKGKGNLFGAKTLQQDINRVVDTFGDCYIGKFDIEGFFMSIDKNILWEKIKKVLSDYICGKEGAFYKELIKKVLFNAPQKNCVRRSPSWMWDKLPKHKSLFGLSDNYGLPIGNLPSQIFSNLYLSDFDKMTSSLFNAYGRYCDDFYVLSHSIKNVVNNISTLREFLIKFHLKLHKRKVYVQHYTKGVPFIGFFVYANRLYTNNRTIHNFKKCVNNYDNNVIRLNSYFGFLHHTNSYNVRKEISTMLSKSIICVYPYLKCKNNINCYGRDN